MRGVCILKHSILLCGALMLGACNPIYMGGGEPLAQMTFNHVRAYPVYVASYELVKFVRSKENTLPEGFVSDPAIIVHDYLKSRFEASGSQGKLRAIIKGVIVQHKSVPSKNKIGAVLNVANMDHYTVRITVALQAFGTVGHEFQNVTLTAHRNFYVSEYSSLVEREEAQMLALDRLIDDLDISIRAVLKDQFKVI